MANIDTYIKNFADESGSAAIYQVLGDVEKDERLAEVFHRMAATERAHVDHWVALMKEAGAPEPVFKPSWRIRTLLWMARRFGPNMMLPSMQNMEREGTAGYAQQAAGG